MEGFSLKFVLIVLGLLCVLQSSFGIRFVIDREECFSYSVPYEGDKVHVSFVVIKADTPWHYGDDGVDLVVCVIKHSLNPSCCLRYYYLNIAGETQLKILLSHCLG